MLDNRGSLHPLAGPVCDALERAGLAPDVAAFLGECLTSRSVRRWYLCDDAEFLAYVRERIVEHIGRIRAATEAPAEFWLRVLCEIPVHLVPARWPNPILDESVPSTRFTEESGDYYDDHRLKRVARAVWSRWAKTTLRQVLTRWPSLDFDAALNDDDVVKACEPAMALSGRWDGCRDHVAELFSTLVAEQRLDPTRHISVDAVIAARGVDKFDNRATFQSVALIERWLDWMEPLRDSVWPYVGDILAQLPDDRAGAFAIGAYHALHRWVNIRLGTSAFLPGASWATTSESWGTYDRSLEFANALVPIARHLNDRIEPLVVDKQEVPEELRLASWLFTWRAFESRSDRIPEALRTRLVDEANRMLGGMRSIVRKAAEDPNAAQEFETETGNAEFAILLLATFGSLWAAMKQLLLLYSYLPVPATSDDTRYWTDRDGEPPPEPWCWIPRMISGALHTYFRRAESNDEGLVELRTSLADFCVSRLTTREKSPRLPLSDTDLKEPRPAWRAGCIRAVKQLGVNPRGGAHKSLNWTADHDPDEGVRDLARSAATVLIAAEQEPPLDNRRARRGIYEAIWHLRRAALEACGVVVNNSRARSVLDRESGYTHVIVPPQRKEENGSTRD